MSKNILRKLVQKTGFDFHRYHTGPEKIDYIKTLGIQTVLDVGANIGQFAKEIRKSLPGAIIYSFEPLKDCFEKLEANMQTDKNFKAFHFALGEGNEEIEMEKNEYAPSSSILPLSSHHKELFPHAKQTTREKILVKRLDDVAKDLNLVNEILIKVDVQGFEDKVISGGTQTFSQAKALIMETSFIELYAGQPTFGKIYDQLKSLGFSYAGSLQEKVDKKTGKIISEDSLFLR